MLSILMKIMVLLQILFCEIGVAAAANCGVPYYKPSIAVDGAFRMKYRVIGGTESKKNSWPFVVSMYVEWKPNDKGEPFAVECSGTVISADWLLTSKHCFYDQLLGKVTRFAVTFGSHYKQLVDYCFLENPDRQIKYWNGLDNMNYDLALVDIRQCNIKMSRKIQPICVPHRSFRDQRGTQAVVVGWGQTQTVINPNDNLNYGAEGSSSPNLQQAILRISDFKTCKKNYSSKKQTVHDHMMCAQNKKADACKGDSGGPLLVMEKGSWTLIGVVHKGIGCANMKFPGVFIDVYKAKAWIKKITKIGT